MSKLQDATFMFPIITICAFDKKNYRESSFLLRISLLDYSINIREILKISRIFISFSQILETACERKLHTSSKEKKERKKEKERSVENNYDKNKDARYAR